MKRLRIEPEALGLDGQPELLDVVEHAALSPVRMLGGCRIGSVEYWYHPPSDCVVRADKWVDCVEGVEDYAP